MIAFAKPTTRTRTALELQSKFLELLPSIRRQARVAFRNEPPERRQDLVAEVLANCWVAFVRLMERGLESIVFATPLANFAIRQARAGRKTGSRSNVRDVSSEYAQRSRGFHIERLDRYDSDNQAWKELIVEDRKAGPAETAACRIDFNNWLASLPRKSRKIAEMLARGETTKATAKRYHVSPGRISQMRRELMRNWQAFQGEAVSS